MVSSSPLPFAVKRASCCIKLRSSPILSPLISYHQLPPKNKEKNMESRRVGDDILSSLIQSHLFRVQISFCAHKEGKWTNSVKKQSHKPSGTKDGFVYF